jgi:2-phospho-L-lactate transferase/gluconeogenesis factor (CofD/UPF0052 family)
VSGFKEAISNSKAKTIFPINLTNKQGHTMYWKVSDYVKDVEKYIDKKVDFILINNESPSKEQLEIYKLKEGSGVLVDNDILDPRIKEEPLLSTKIITYSKSDTLKNVRSFIRHDSKKLANCIEKIIKE